jgi:predicted secreted hydrolase
VINKNSKIEFSYNNPSKLIPQDITPSDDAFHGSTKHVAAEWWYFDAVFTNNYSLHLGCRTFSKKNLGLISPFLEIYKDGKIAAKAVKRYFFRDFKTSKDFPMVTLLGNSVLKFDQKRYQEKKEWAYDLTLSIDDYEVDLRFIGSTKGWKFETQGESWTVALPKASATGKIIMNDDEIKVQGTGYHDHNWNYTIWTPLNYGKAWLWGKIISKNFNVSWANIIKKGSKREFIAVVNQDNKGYYPINSEKIFFKPNNFIRSHRQKIPTSFTLKINDSSHDTPINIDVQMDAYDTHYSKALFFPYWRHHVKSTGIISVGSHKETVNRTQIMEYLKFG